MGVPKFYRWISERYPCLSEIVREYQIPDFDNLYLDMNGIIHNCSHPNDDDVHFRMSEEQVFKDIFRYVEFLFRMIKPRKVFFMAIDGVAPRAKMNQQRGRRFRSAQEAEKREEEAKKRGEVLPKEARFDSNCITPGTEFMDRLNNALKWWVSHKISTDDMWRNVRVILSGHETPGEGEHKIMDFIRYERSQPGYDPSIRHCLYGLDADLIVLGLCSHEPHFSLLREEVKFLKTKKEQGKQVTPQKLSRSVNPDVITFHLLHLSLLRNYLDHEFSPMKNRLPFPYDIEKIIDDWILMGFLVGNDFIPHIPHFHINKNSLPLLYKVYMEVMPTLDGYLNEDGILNLERFEVFLRKVSEIDEENFMETFADLKYFESKSSKCESTKVKKTFEKFYDESESKKVNQEISVSSRFSALEEEDAGVEVVSPAASDEYEEADVDETSDSIEEEDEFDTFDDEFRLHKRQYYETKLELPKVDEEALREQAYCYVRALQWNLHYYYNGCVSWSWFYPHHYAPYISDVKDFKNVDMSFEWGKPFKPFEQLLAVLPAASKELLPKAYQRLLTDINSPIIHNYPTKFELDMNEKQQDWEAVVKINFIDEKELLAAADECSLLFSAKERERNIHGPHMEFTYSPQQQPSFPSPAPFLPAIQINHAVLNFIDMDKFRIAIDQIKKGRLTEGKVDVHYPGFATLFYIDHIAELRKERVKVFEMASQHDNMILTITPSGNADGWHVAEELIGKTVFINWPHLQEAMVEKVADGKFFYAKDGEGALQKTQMKEKELRDLEDQVISVSRHYKERKGIIIGGTTVVLISFPITGRKYVLTSQGRVTLEKEWSTIPSFVPYQMVVKDLTVEDSDLQKFKTIDEVFPIGCQCFSLAPGFYGQPCQVIAINHSGDNVTVKVAISSTHEPDLSEVIEMEEALLRDEYCPNYVLAQRLGISGHVLSRLTGTIFVSGGTGAKVNIGLGLRFNTKSEEVPGFSRKVEDMWYLTNKVGDMIKEYIEKFPQVVEKLTTAPNKDVFSMKDLFPEGSTGKGMLQELFNWLKTLPCYRADRQKVGAEVLDECVVKYLEKFLNSAWTVEEKAKKMTLNLKPEFLFRPLHYMRYSLPDPSAKFNLYDRVVNVRTGISVPLGLKGVIIGKHVDSSIEVNTVYDVLFDEEFPGGAPIRCSSQRCYKMSPANLINLTYGASLAPKKGVPKPTQHVALQPSKKSNHRLAGNDHRPQCTITLGKSFAQIANGEHQKKMPQQRNGGINVNALNKSLGQKQPSPPSARKPIGLKLRSPTEPRQTPRRRIAAVMTVDMLEKEMTCNPPQMISSASPPGAMTVEMLEKSFQRPESPKESPPKKPVTTPGKRRVAIESLIRSHHHFDGEVTHNNVINMKNGNVIARTRSGDDKKSTPPRQQLVTRILQRPKEAAETQIEQPPITVKQLSQQQSPTLAPCEGWGRAPSAIQKSLHFVPTQVTRKSTAAPAASSVAAPATVTQQTKKEDESAPILRCLMVRTSPAKETMISAPLPTKTPEKKVMTMDELEKSFRQQMPTPASASGASANDSSSSARTPSNVKKRLAINL